MYAARRTIALREKKSGPERCLAVVSALTTSTSEVSRDELVCAVLSDNLTHEEALLQHEGCVIAQQQATLFCSCALPPRPASSALSAAPSAPPPTPVSAGPTGPIPALGPAVTMSLGSSMDSPLPQTPGSPPLSTPLSRVSSLSATSPSGFPLPTCSLPASSPSSSPHDTTACLLRLASDGAVPELLAWSRQAAAAFLDAHVAALCRDFGLTAAPVRGDGQRWCVRAVEASRSGGMLLVQLQHATPTVRLAVYWVPGRLALDEMLKGDDSLPSLSCGTLFFFPLC